MRRIAENKAYIEEQKAKAAQRHQQLAFEGNEVADPYHLELQFAQAGDDFHVESQASIPEEESLNYVGGSYDLEHAFQNIGTDESA